MKFYKFLTFLTVLFSLLALSFSLLLSRVSAQSPIQCGLLNEVCCNLAGSPPNSCKQNAGLKCDTASGKCVADGSGVVPPTRGGTSSSGPLPGLQKPPCGMSMDPEFNSLRPYQVYKAEIDKLIRLIGINITRNIL